MSAPATSPRLTSLARRFLVDDLARAMAYYRDRVVSVAGARA